MLKAPDRSSPVFSELSATPVVERGNCKIGYRTRRGVMYVGQTEHVLATSTAKALRGKVDLIFTSPPFPLDRKKRYGNEQGAAYIERLARFAPLFREFLSPTGSVVIE